MSKYRCTTDTGCASYHSSPEEARDHLTGTNLAVLASVGTVIGCIVIGYVVCCCIHYFKKRKAKKRQEDYAIGKVQRTGSPNCAKGAKETQETGFHNKAFSEVNIQNKQTSSHDLMNTNGGDCLQQRPEVKFAISLSETDSPVPHMSEQSEFKEHGYSMAAEEPGKAVMRIECLSDAVRV